MESTTTEVEIVAKTQKTFYLNDDLTRLLEAHSKATGASFTRMMSAAVLQFLFTHPSGPDAWWMEHAVELELSEITVGDMPQQRLNDLSAEDMGELGSLEVGPDGVVKQLPVDPSKRWERWTAMARRRGDDPVQHIVDHWTEERKRTPGT